MPVRHSSKIELPDSAGLEAYEEVIEELDEDYNVADPLEIFYSRGRESDFARSAEGVFEKIQGYLMDAGATAFAGIGFALGKATQPVRERLDPAESELLIEREEELPHFVYFHEDQDELEIFRAPYDYGFSGKVNRYTLSPDTEVIEDVQAAIERAEIQALE